MLAYDEKGTKNWQMLEMKARYQANT